MSDKKLIFVGCRQTMGSLANIAELCGIEILGILDSHYYGNTDDVAGVPVIGDERWLLDPNNAQAQAWRRDCVFFPGNWHVGDQTSGLDQLRLRRINIMEQAGVEVINLIHPFSSVASDSRYGFLKLGKGIQINPGVCIQTDTVEIGDYSAFELDVTIAHDTKIGKNVLVGPRAYLYNCTIHDNVYIGIFSQLNSVAERKALPGHVEPIVIGENSTVWHSAEVTRDIPANHIWTTDGRILRKVIRNNDKEKINVESF